MSTQDPTVTTTSSASDTQLEGTYARKLGLAILSVLQEKGVFSEKDVDTILLAVNRAMQQQRAPEKAEPGNAETAVPRIDMEL